MNNTTKDQNNQIATNINNNLINSIADQPNNIINTNDKQVKTIKKPKGFQKGQSGNPKGRPKNPEIDQLRLALKEAGKKNGNKTYLQHIAERFYKSDAVMVSICKKLLPDLSSVNTELGLKGFRLVIERTSDNKVELGGK